MLRSGGQFVFANVRRFHRNIAAVRYLANVALAEYPEIKPKFPPGQWSSDMQPEVCWEVYEEGQSIKQIPTVKERLEKFAGSESKWMVELTGWDTSPEIVDYKQYMTKTHVIANSLPPHYESIAIDGVYERIKPQLLTVLAQAFTFAEDHTVKSGDLNNTDLRNNHLRINKFFGSLLNTIVSQLSPQSSGLRRCQIDENVRVETWFKRYGFDGDDKPVKDKWNGVATVQYKGTANLQLRTELPISEFVPLDDKLCTEAAYPAIDYAPMAIGQREIQGRPITLSGHWIGDPCEFTPLSVHIMPPRITDALTQLGTQYLEEGSLVAGLTTSFASCMAQAHNQGFNWLHDITYPFTTQSVIVRDNKVRLCCYQLNTTQLWKDDAANPRRNILWVSDEMPLFESIAADGNVTGLNDDLCKKLVKFVAMPTSDRGGINLRPYLPDETAPRLHHVFINNKGEEPLPYSKIGRFQYPRNSVYFT